MSYASLRYRTPVLIIFFNKIYFLCKNNALSKVLNKLQAFYFRSTVYTNTTPTVITHSYVLQKPPFCNNNGLSLNLTGRPNRHVSKFLAKNCEMLEH